MNDDVLYRSMVALLYFILHKSISETLSTRVHANVSEQLPEHVL